MAGDTGGDVQPLHRAHQATPGLRDDLRHLSAEQAATVLVDAFARTGYAEAMVTDPSLLRRLVRRDCRRRKMPLRTVAAGATVALIDQQRHDGWLESDEGREYAQARDAAVMRALENAIPTLGKPPRHLRPVPGDDE